MVKGSTKVLMVAGLCLAFGQAYATNLPVGGLTLNAGSGFAGAPAGSVTDLENWKAGSTTIGSVNFVEGVWVDPTTHFLDFFYQIQNNSPAATQLSNTVGNLAGAPNPGQTTLTLTGFGTFTESVFDITSATYVPGSLGGSLFKMPTSGNAVINANNSTPNDVIVNFNHSILPGQNSAILVIKTNASAFDTGGEGLFNWRQNPSRHGATSGTSFTSELIDAGTLEPTQAPEPGVYGALSLGIAGLFLAVRRRSEKAKN